MTFLRLNNPRTERPLASPAMLRSTYANLGSIFEIDKDRLMSRIRKFRNAPKSFDLSGRSIYFQKLRIKNVEKHKEITKKMLMLGKTLSIIRGFVCQSINVPKNAEKQNSVKFITEAFLKHAFIKAESPRVVSKYSSFVGCSKGSETSLELSSSTNEQARDLDNCEKAEVNKNSEIEGSFSFWKKDDDSNYSVCSENKIAEEIFDLFAPPRELSFSEEENVDFLTRLRMAL